MTNGKRRAAISTDDLLMYWLAEIYEKFGIPRQEIPFSIVDSLTKLRFVSIENALSNTWYKSRQPAKMMEFIFINSAGRIALVAWRQAKMEGKQWRKN